MTDAAIFHLYKPILEEFKVLMQEIASSTHQMSALYQSESIFREGLLGNG